MPQTETYLMRALTPPTGVMLSDFSYIVDGQMRPVLLKTNEQINLEHVEVDKYVRSAVLGTLASMLESGSMVRVMVEVSEKRYDELRAEFLKVPKPRKESPYAHATQVISIEAGLMVAVGGAPVVNSALPPEPPVVVPVVEPEIPGQPVEPGLQAGAQAHAPTQEEEQEIVSWKDGKTLSEQEKFIKESIDKVFLNAVINDKEETKKIQRLAKARLSELE